MPDRSRGATECLSAPLATRGTPNARVPLPIEYSPYAGVVPVGLTCLAECLRDSEIRCLAEYLRDKNTLLGRMLSTYDDLAICHLSSRIPERQLNAESTLLGRMLSAYDNDLAICHREHAA